MLLTTVTTRRGHDQCIFGRRVDVWIGFLLEFLGIAPLDFPGDYCAGGCFFCSVPIPGLEWMDCRFCSYLLVPRIPGERSVANIRAIPSVHWMLSGVRAELMNAGRETILRGKAKSWVAQMETD